MKKETETQNLLDFFLEALIAERNSANNTIEAYNHDLKDFSVFLQKKYWKSLKDATENDIFAYRKFLVKSDMKSSTIARKLIAIRQLFGFLFQESVITYNPARNISLPKQTKVLPKILEKEEIFAILEKAMKDQTAEGRRKWALFELLYGAGLRVSELISLKIGNFTINQKTHQIEPFVMVKGKGGKERFVPIHETCIVSLEAYLGIRDVFVKDRKKGNLWLFPSKSKAGYLTRQYVAKLLKKTAQEVGIPKEKLSPHVIRHAFATHLLEGGANILVIQRLLGHTDISTTQIYTHVKSKHLAELVEKYHPLSIKA
ncbi:MAG: site-specific tyrosine recombinase XerD [Holosporales bacterium]|jgi:integrase/recombinase XerD|nr:site-specific tyrosine recombinase XerD [Holosporales bacterium]